jgi:serine phosphatase RsbU (regulator of sigma subunit)
MPSSARRTGLHTSATTAAELARLHETALPGPATAPFDLACWSSPLATIGGDLLVAWPVGLDRMLVLLADVMGHDLTAAIIASAVRLDLYRIREMGINSPASILQRLDRAMGELFPPYFMTAACCLLDSRRQTMMWSLAGHYPILVRDSVGNVSRLQQRTFAAGMNSGERYYNETTHLGIGSTVLLYSDGVSESLGSIDALSRLVANGDTPTADETISTVRRTIRTLPRTDDRSLLAVRLVD